MNRFRSRTSALTAGLAACALATGMTLTGCSVGQVSQTATQAPAVNGTGATVGDITLRNIHLRAAQTIDYVQPGRNVELLLVASNGSAEDDDKLVTISSDVGAVTITGDATVPAGGVLVVGTPDGQIAPLESVEAADAAEASVALAKPITNGLTYNFTFTFERAGQTEVGVPISAGETPRREGTAEAGDTGGHH